MATDLERLVVSLDADISRLTKQLSKAGINLDDFSKVAERKAGDAAKSINKHLAPSSGSGGLNFIQFQELSSAARHGFDAIIAGASPLRVLATEGAKASSAIGPGGLGGFAKQLGTSLGTVLTPARLAAGGVAGIGLAALYSYESFEEAQRAIKTGLTGVGAASHATVGDIETIGESVAATSRISVASARSIATAIASTGKVDVGQIAGIANLAKGFGNLTGKSTEDAGKELASIFADPAKGVDTLNERLGALDDKTAQYVKTLTASGDRQRAVQVLLQAVQPDLTKAADNVSVLTRAYEGLKSALSRVSTGVGKGIANVVDGPSLEEQLERAQSQQRSFRPFASSASTAALNAKVKQLQDEIAARDKAQQEDGNRREANELSRQGGDAAREADPAFEQIRQLQERRDVLGKAIGSEVANPSVEIEGGIQHALDAYNSLDVKLKELQKDYAAGGRFAAQALRQADFGKATVGLSNYEKGLAQVRFQYEQLIESARKDGDIRSLGTLTKARDTAVQGYKDESFERAKSETVVSSDLVKAIIGSEGNNASRNPASTASGIGQFLDSTFIEQFRKVFSDTAAQIDQKNTGADGKVNQSAVNAAILAQKSDVSVNEKLIESYAHEIGLQITKAGFNGNDQRNQYLGFHFGAGGASALLGANPNASASDILGPKVTAANQSEVQGRTAEQLIDLIYTRFQKNTSTGRGQQSQAIAETAGGQVYDKSAAAAARLQSIQEQLNADRDVGGELGKKFATAQDLEAASSDKLTPALAAQKKAIEELADARAKATSSTLASRFDTDQKNVLDALGRTSEQQQIFTGAKQFAEPGTDQFKVAADGLQRLQTLNSAKDTGASFTKGLVSDLIAGQTAGKALENQLQRILGKLADSTIDSLFASLFSGLTGGKGGGGGILSAIGGLVGLKLADGGSVRGPGTSRSDSVPAMLSHGEFVVNAASASKNAGLLALINSGKALKLANGGMVGGMPSIPNAVAVAGGGSSLSVTHAPIINMTSAQGITAEQVAKAIAKNQQEADRNFLKTYDTARRRY